MPELNEQQLAAMYAGLAKLREPFSKDEINYLPRATCDKDEYRKLTKGKCSICGNYHATTKTVHLAYVGHAALTNRLLNVDPLWTWEPQALDEAGLPLFDKTGGLWIKLTVCGLTRPGYGHAEEKPYSEHGSREKEVIGDAIRNAAMRFGAALELWHKGTLDLPDENESTEPVSEKPESTVAMPRPKSKAKEADANQPTSEPAEIGEVNYLLNRFKALKQSTPSDVLVEAGYENLAPDTLEGL